MKQLLLLIFSQILILKSDMPKPSEMVQSSPRFRIPIQAIKENFESAL